MNTYFTFFRTGVGPRDEGTYTCSLLGRRGDIIAHSSVRVMVDSKSHSFS